MYAYFDSSQFPLVIIRFRKLRSQEEFDQYLKDSDQLYKYAGSQNKKMFVVFDFTRSPFPGMNYLNQMANYMKLRREWAKKYINKTTFVIPSWVARSFLAMLFNLQPPVNEYQTFDNVVDAVKWLGFDPKKLTLHNLPLGQNSNSSTIQTLSGGMEAKDVKK